MDIDAILYWSVMGLMAILVVRGYWVNVIKPIIK